MDNYISIIDLSRVLGISRQTILKQLQGKIRAGEINVKTEGKKYLIKYETLPEGFRERVERSKKEAAKKATEILSDPNKDLHFEKELWAAADKLRGNIDASDYKHIVLGLIFLRYISDAFYHRREKLIKWMSDKNNKKYYVPDEE